MPGLRGMSVHSAAEKLRRGVWHQFQVWGRARRPRRVFGRVAL